MVYTYRPKDENLEFLGMLNKTTGVSMDQQLDYAVELLVGEYDWDSDQFLDNLRHHARRSSDAARLDPEERLHQIARDVHDYFFAQDSVLGDVDDVQRKLEAIYRPLVDEGYLDE